MIKLDDTLTGVSNLGLDTAPVIYFVEAHPRYDALVNAVFERISVGALAGWTSVVTLSEVLVQPILKANANLQQQYQELLLRSNNFHTISINATIAERAAHLRARYRLRTPDALQIAVALDAGCEAFLCNDTGLRRVTELRVLVLNDLEL
jgi:predicted nucleic acid-binding protein